MCARQQKRGNLKLQQSMSQTFPGFQNIPLTIYQAAKVSTMYLNHAKQHSWEATNGPVSLGPTIVIITTKNCFNAILTFNWNANKIFIFRSLRLQEDGKLFK